MNLGEFVICKDFQQIGWYFQNHPNDKTRIIVLDDEVVHAEGYIQGSLLLPPPSALFTLIDTGDIMQFQEMYYKYLHLPDIDQFIMLMITALFSGVNIILFFNTSDPSMFMDYLAIFFNRIYGAYPTPFEQLFNPHPQSIIPDAMSLLLQKMVQFEYISVDEYNSYFSQVEKSPFQKFSMTPGA